MRDLSEQQLLLYLTKLSAGSTFEPYKMTQWQFQYSDPATQRTETLKNEWTKWECAASDRYFIVWLLFVFASLTQLKRARSHTLFCTHCELRSNQRMFDVNEKNRAQAHCEAPASTSQSLEANRFRAISPIPFNTLYIDGWCLFLFSLSAIFCATFAFTRLSRWLHRSKTTAAASMCVFGCAFERTIFTKYIYE